MQKLLWVTAAHELRHLIWESHDLQNINNNKGENIFNNNNKNINNNNTGGEMQFIVN